nr:hypothetical protein [Tanacetum cinerariifolium]
MYNLADITILKRNKYGAILPNELTNEAIKNLESYKEYYAIASGAEPSKTKASVRKKQVSFDTTMPPPNAKGKRLKTSAKVDKPAKEKQPVKTTKAKGLTVLSEKSSEEDDDDQDDDDNQDDDDEQTNSDSNGDDFVHTKFSTHNDEDKEEQSFDPIVQTPSHVENTYDEDSHDAQQTNVLTTQETKDTHVIITPVNPKGQQQSSYVSSCFILNMLNPSPDTGIDSIFNLNTESTSQVDVPVTTTAELPLLSVTTLPPPTTPIISHLQQTSVPLLVNVPSSSLQVLPNFGSLFGFDHRLKSLEVNFLEFMHTNQFAEAISSIPDIVDKYLDKQMNEAVKVAAQLQSDRLRYEAQAENEYFLNKLDENIKKIFKEQVKEQVKAQVSKILLKIKKTVNEQLEAEVLTPSSNSSETSHDVAASQSKLELKKIIIDKMESNKLIHRSDEQKNLYKALVDAYEFVKLILNTYKDTVTLKRCRDDEDKDETPSLNQTGGPREEDLEKNSSLLVHQRRRLLSFVMNRLKVDTLTPELLTGPTFELMKGSCKSLVELEYFFEEVYKETTDQLDWNNPEGQQYPHDLRKPLPLIPNSQGRRVIHFDHFVNNDLEYLCGECGVKCRSATTIMHSGESRIGGTNVNSSMDLLLTGNVIEISTPNDESSLSQSSKYIVIQRRVEDLQLGVKSYQKKINLINPDTYRLDLKRKEAYTAYSNPRGFIYQNKDKKNRLMRINELHKFSDGTLNDVQTALDDCLKGIQMQYVPQTIWR